MQWAFTVHYNLLCKSVDGNIRSTCKFTDDDEDKDEGGHSGAYVEHDSDVVRQLVHIIHVRHKDGRDQEPNGNTHLWTNSKKHFNTTAFLAHNFRHSNSTNTHQHM